jgi:hypothetical protein
VEALRNEVRDLRRRLDALARGAETLPPTGVVGPGTGRVRAAKVKDLFDDAGNAYVDFETDRWVAFARCRWWNLATEQEGTRDLWIAFRRYGWFGMPAQGDDPDFGVAVGDVIAYLPSGLEIDVPGQAEGTTFDGFLEPVLSTWLGGVGEVPTPVEPDV